MNTLLDAAQLLIRADNGSDDGNTGPPPGTPPTRIYEGPWFSTQLTLSGVIGLVSFLLFSYCRTRWPVLYAPRTKLKGFSPHEAHAGQAFFGWIMPTLKTSEYTILQIVGLDAAVMLNFFKMAFQLFLAMSVFAMLVIMPINYKNNLSFFAPDDDPDDRDTPSNMTFIDSPNNKTKTPKDGESWVPHDWVTFLTESNGLYPLQLVSTYLFTILTLRFLFTNYKRFIRARQLYSLELVHSIPARTVMVTNLPNHLQGERSLAVYFENMGLNVESVSVCREVAALAQLLEKRTQSLLALEKAWVNYVGNPSTVENYDPESSAVAPLIDIDVESQQATSRVVPHRSRPTIRPSLLKPQVDAIEYLEGEFNRHDEAVKKRRKTGKFRATHAAFVTFETMTSAQIAAQVVTAPYHSEAITILAPEPKDIVWSNMNFSPNSIRFRELSSLAMMILLLFFWVVPIGSLAVLLSYEEIKRVMPWLAHLIDQSDRIKAIIQHSLPTVGVILVNALLPIIFEYLAYFQGIKARSWIEYSIMKRYFLFLLVNVIFIFLFVSSFLQVFRDLYEAPGKFPEKLASALNTGNAKSYFVCYVILQALGITPLQLLNLGVVAPRIFYRLFITRSPRDFAELNAPPMINYGAVYPQCILVFVATLLYSIQQPLILPFGTLFFGMSYIVYKYKLLFVFYKPYESHGQAWPITFIRLIWGVIIFQLFMTGLFLLNQHWYVAIAVAPLIGFTAWWGWYIHRAFQPLSLYVSLSAASEVQKGVENEEVLQLHAGHPVTRSQSNLNRRRYAEHDDTLYVAPEDERTDYSQPPMSNWYYGVLNTGKRRYGHPALTGVLPQPWLPLKKGQTLVNRSANQNQKGSQDNALVLTLRRRSSVARKKGKQGLDGVFRGTASRSETELAANPWSGAPLTPAQPGPTISWESQEPASTSSPRRLHHRMSWDPASGVMALPENGNWLDGGEDSDSDEDYGTSEGNSTPSGGGDTSEAGAQLELESEREQLQQPTSQVTPRKRHATYFHHPEKRASIRPMPGDFPR